MDSLCLLLFFVIYEAKIKYGVKLSRVNTPLTPSAIPRAATGVDTACNISKIALCRGLTRTMDHIAKTTTVKQCS